MSVACQCCPSARRHWLRAHLEKLEDGSVANCAAGFHCGGNLLDNLRLEVQEGHKFQGRRFGGPSNRSSRLIYGSTNRLLAGACGPVQLATIHILVDGSEKVVGLERKKGMVSIVLGTSEEGCCGSPLRSNLAERAEDDNGIVGQHELVHECSLLRR